MRQTLLYLLCILFLEQVIMLTEQVLSMHTYGEQDYDSLLKRRRIFYRAMLLAQLSVHPLLRHHGYMDRQGHIDYISGENYLSEKGNQKHRRYITNHVSLVKH